MARKKRGKGARLKEKNMSAIRRRKRDRKRGKPVMAVQSHTPPSPSPKDLPSAEEPDEKDKEAAM